MTNKNNIKHTIITVILIGAVAWALIFLLTRGRTGKLILGTWVVDTAGVESGFQCGKDGIAASVNDKKHQYSSWELDGDNLILKGKLFVRNDNEYRVHSMADTLTIKDLAKEELTVEHHGNTIKYRKTR